MTAHTGHRLVTRRYPRPGRLTLVPVECRTCWRVVTDWRECAVRGCEDRILDGRHLCAYHYARALGRVA